MWLLKKISCEIQILNEKVGKLMIENGKLEEENKKLKEKISELEDVSEDYDLLSKDFITLGEENDKLKEIIDVKTKDYNDLVDENEELKDELWVRKHCVAKLRKDKELYEKARDVMFGKEEEDLYEDIPTINIDKDGNIIDENGDKTYVSFYHEC